MTSKQTYSHPKLLWLLFSLTLLAISAPLQSKAQEKVIWVNVSEEQANQLEILVPTLDDGADSFTTNPSLRQAAPEPIVSNKAATDEA